MSDTVTLTIDGQEITVSAEATILEAAAQLGIEIPVICYHPHLTANGLCRVCSVDSGGRAQSAACVTRCQQGMQIETHSDDVKRGRRTILELLASTVNLEDAPEILALLERYSAETDRFSGAKRDSPVYDDNPFYLRDYNQCINCWRCVQVCAEDAQYAFALNFNGRGFHTTIATYQNNGMMDTTCVFCGQCVGVCPTGALKPKRQAMLEEGVSPDDIFYQTRGGRKKRKTDSS
ncbi:MAG: 2Fe-2S iron-sulfur cluster-binding protein [Anaerolineae bacterium]|nr:2Fe-2S iron-sulfur cluster-binding protein [Anaerolineae bacterium]MCO5193645.1 2Fe-2S iron-sulfur cluster-binding protein [Anaerolineae bacterium]MCO5200068.1 2Fe-2S iron-sulfur cluster-binding protein [Anaerolineae bacterium]MCO5206517.1 2Fe-2S iron-sulfur cluster-binding protein [Anaerolineae bacterium]